MPAAGAPVVKAHTRNVIVPRLFLRPNDPSKSATSANGLYLNSRLLSNTLMEFHVCVLIVDARSTARTGEKVTDNGLGFSDERLVDLGEYEAAWDRIQY